MSELNRIGQRLVDGLSHASRVEDEMIRQVAHAEKIQVVGAGGTVTAAYEQLRNAAESTEEHLLPQNAIRRFFKQLFMTRDEQLVASCGNELAIELTYAGYVPNGSLTMSQVSKISKLASAHYHAYELLQKKRSFSSDTTTKWILDTLSVETEMIVNRHLDDDAFIETAYAYFENAIPKEATVRKATEDQYGAALLVAVHRALLKSNNAMIRTALLKRYHVTIDDLDAYISYNQRIDVLFDADVTRALYRIVDRQGAPFRIVRHMIEDGANMTDLLPKRVIFLEAFEQQIGREYARIGSRITRAIVRSVIFLVITKVLIGVAIEVPYDLWSHGRIIWLPLIINLLFPPLYMIALRMTHTLPGYSNTAALTDRIDAILYGEYVPLMRRQLVGRRYGPIFSVIYTVLSLLVFGGAMWGLLMLDFSLVHIAIFFVFVSAASFLGFRISRMIRDLEVVRGTSTSVTFIRDIVYLPFVVVGQWMSDKYNQINLVGTLLDMVIELPLKTVLRLIRQWAAFIDDRKDKIV